MATVKAVACAGLKLCEPLICVGLKSVLKLPDGLVDAGAKWVKERFTDHSLVLTKAVATAHDRAWQAVALALATDNLFSHVANLFRDGDLKAVQKQIREFVATADTGLDGAAAGLRTKACNELLQLKKAGRFALDGAELTSLDLTRFASSAKVTDDAHSAILLIVAGVQADAPHLAKVLTLTPPAGGTPLLAAAFAYFLRREIATKPELARELHYDQLRLLTLKQQAGFGNIEAVIESKSGELLEVLGGWFATADADLADIKAKLEQLLEENQVSKKPESPLRVSVTSETELQRLKQLRDRLREKPAELVDAELRSMLGDGLAAANQCADALTEHAAAAAAAHDAADSTAEADAVYKQYKDACELKQWDTALSALKQAVALDERRFRPVPKHYAVDAVLGAGSFGVVLKCRDTAERGDDGQHLVVAVKTFRAADLDRPFDEVFAEASVLKTLNHENVIRIHERGFADGDAQQRPFLAMEFVPGVTLEEHLAQHGRLSEDDFTSIFRQIAAGLHAAHTARRRVIHRDLKPANVMVWKDGDVWRVKVIDFGLAVRGAIRSSSVSVPHSLRATRDKAITGTIKYAAPEQLGEKPYPVGPHSDVFAFGKTGLEALFGTVQPTPKHWKQLPEAFAELLARCVDEEYDPYRLDEGRYHTFGPVLEVLAPSHVSTPTSNPLPPPPPLQRVAVVPVGPPADVLLAPIEPPKLRATCAQCVTRFSYQPSRVGETMPCPKCQVELILPTQDGGTAWSRPNHYVNSKELTQPTQDSGTVLLLTTQVASRRLAKSVRKAGDRYQLELPGGLKMPFAWCPPGTFLMGCQESEAVGDGDQQQHEVRITKVFYAGVHPVTQAEWKAVMGTAPSYFEGANLPVEQVNWNEAQAFCHQIREMTGKQVRLPTEAEWEYACRGGTTTPFYWGGELNGTQANCDGTSPYGTSAEGPFLQGTSPVGSYADKAPKKHPWGLTDVHGNVWEWCADWYDAGFYTRSPKEDPECGDGEQKYRVLRGGSWGYGAWFCRAASRHWVGPARRRDNYGFRVVFNPE